jgi:energy-coupling factor transporter ATP-binding protein EcfA2
MHSKPLGKTVEDQIRLESVTLKQVGVFEDIRIDFPPLPVEDRGVKAEIHLLTGPNGCGKSTLLYALAAIFAPPHEMQLVKRRFRTLESSVDFSFGNTVGKFGVKIPAENGVFPSEYGQVQVWHNDQNNGLYFATSRDAFQASFGTTTLISYKGGQTGIQPGNPLSSLRLPYAAFAYSGQRTITNVGLNAIQQISNSPFESALSFDATVRPAVLVQWIANNRAQAALARADGEMEAAVVYDQALAKVTSVIKEVCGVEIEFRVQRSPLAVTALMEGVVVPFDGLPDGLKSIITWVADLTIRLESIPWVETRDMFEQRIMLFLDEIDVHLHPKWQRRILPAIQKMLPNSQIFVSTHSPFVVGSVEDAWVYRLPERGKQTDRIVSPIPSAAGRSYRFILDEVFGIDREFDVQTESLFDQFYVARDNFVRNQSNTDSLRQLATELAQRSEEAMVIVESELRQISRRTGVEVRLA